MKWFVLVLFYGSFFAFAQHEKPTVKMPKVKEFTTLRNQIEVYTTKFPDSAFSVATKMVNDANHANNSELKAIANSALGFVLISLTQLSEAENLLKEAIRLNKNQKNNQELAINYNYLALVYQRRSDFVKASDYFFESLDMAEKQKNFNLIQRNYNGISMVFCDQDDFNKALIYAKKSNSIVNYNNDELRHAYSVAILAEVYREMGKYDLSEKYFSQSYESYKKLNDDFGQAWCLTNWSLVYDDSQILKVIDMELKAQAIWDQYFPENMMSMTNLGNLGWSYYVLALEPELIKKINDPKIPTSKNALLNASESYYKKCLELARRKNNTNTLMFFSGSLAELQAYKGDHKSAYENLLLNKQLGDSLYSQENKNKIASFESEKELQAKQNAIEINHLKLQASENQKWFFVGAVILLAIIGILLFYQNRARRKNNLILEQTNDELEKANAAKAKLFGIINHDLRSPVASLVNFLNLQQMQPELLDKPTKDRLMQETLTSTEQLLVTMEDLLQWSKGQMKHFKPEINEVEVSKLFEETALFFRGIHVDLKFVNEERTTLRTDENYLKTILRNLTANAIKAIASVENPMIVWHAFSNKDKLCLTIVDNGPGVSKEQMKVLFDESETSGINKGLGLHIVRDMAKAIECEVVWDENYTKGTAFILKFKKNN